MYSNSVHMSMVFIMFCWFELKWGWSQWRCQWYESIKAVEEWFLHGSAASIIITILYSRAVKCHSVHTQRPRTSPANEDPLMTHNALLLCLPAHQSLHWSQSSLCCHCCVNWPCTGVFKCQSWRPPGLITNTFTHRSIQTNWTAPLRRLKGRTVYS